MKFTIVEKEKKGVGDKKMTISKKLRDASTCSLMLSYLQNRCAWKSNLGSSTSAGGCFTAAEKTEAKSTVLNILNAKLTGEKVSAKLCPAH